MKFNLPEKILVLDKKLLNEAAKVYPVHAATDFHNYMIEALQRAGFKVMCNNDFSSGKHEFAGFKLNQAFNISTWQLIKSALKEKFSGKQLKDINHTGEI